MYIADSVGQSSAAQRSAAQSVLLGLQTKQSRHKHKYKYTAAAIHTHTHTCCNAMLQLNFHIDIWRQNDKL